MLAAMCDNHYCISGSVSDRSNQAQERGYIALHDVNIKINTAHRDKNR
jgi:hypothetical protein